MSVGQDGGMGFSPPDGGQWPNAGSPPQSGAPYGYPTGDPGTQPGMYGAPYGGQGAWPYGPGSEPPKKSRRGLITGLVIAAVVVVLGGVLALANVAYSRSGDDRTPVAGAPSGAPPATRVPHAIVLPKSVGPYRRLNGSAADRLAESVRKATKQAAPEYSAAYAHATVAIYAKNGDPAHPIVFMGLSAKDSPATAKQLEVATPSEEVDWFITGTGLSDSRSYPAGPLGGVLRCGAGTGASGPTKACAWADSSTLALLVQAGHGGAGALAGTTLDLRNAAER